MQCKTFKNINENGEKVSNDKKQFDTLEEAIAIAKIENAKPNHFLKVVAYKCKECHKYHIGRNGKEIKQKEKEKLVKELKINEPRFRVVGWIDLNRIKY